MENLLVILFLLSLIQFNYAQKPSVQIDQNYFLIGTLTDYMGRSKYKETNNKVDEYYKYEKSLAFAMDSIFKDIYPDLRLNITKDTNRLELFSKTIADRIDEYYSYKPSGRMTMNYDTIYYGSLRTDIFKTDLQRLSFFTGVYVRFGETNDSTFCIRIHNSKASICVDLLKDLKCTNVEYKVLTGHIPVSHIVYFTPSIELKKYLIEFMYLRQRINNAYIKQIKEMIGEENYNKYAR
jgi:hypothetical protein